MARTERLLDWSVASLLSCPGKQRPNDIVLLDDLVLAQSIDPKTPTLLLLSVPPTTTTLADLHTHLPPTSPQYTFFSFTPPKASATPIVIFVYTCPSKSPIRMRMVYSSSVASLIRAVGEKAGVQVAKKVSSLSRASLSISVAVANFTLLPTSAARSSPLSRTRSPHPRFSLSSATDPSPPHPPTPPLPPRANRLSTSPPLPSRSDPSLAARHPARPRPSRMPGRRRPPRLMRRRGKGSPSRRDPRDGLRAEGSLRRVRRGRADRRGVGARLRAAEGGMQARRQTCSADE